MKGLLALFFCIYTFNKVESYFIEVTSLSFQPTPSITITPIWSYKLENGLNMTQYGIAISEPIDESNDIPLMYTYYDQQNNELYGKSTRLCRASFKNIGGSVAALVARSWGIDSDPVCPTQQTTYQSETLFKIDQGIFDPFVPEEGYAILEVKISDTPILVMNIYDHYD